ncbi:response regulator [Pantanalinema sp. GBBB05]|uniref:response regulator n=1 Tax=Pantanalinema sp. GBBB05 TaxID=2604139 RepID=UPI001D76E2CC|nr:response regulator [Pantanalinema sp. GBBB05]
MTAKTILVIHHEPNMLEVVQACLSDLGGWNVITAASPADGLQQAILKQPDGIVMDLPLAGLHQFTLLEQLRLQPATQMIPIVLLATRAKWLNLQQLQRYQVAGVITHPDDPAFLSKQLSTLLGWDVPA